jgi:uncharacterized membrane protein SpoIIM required for sporulation
MIIDLRKFIAQERGYWTELERLLDMLENDPASRLELGQVKRFHYLYQRASTDLAKIMTFSSEERIRGYLESLVARAYGEIHTRREKPHRISPMRWFFRRFPQTFRRHVRAFWIALAITGAGGLFGGFAVTLDPEAKQVLMPFSHLQEDPSKRVAREEGLTEDRLKGVKTSFSSYLMTHNIKVSILVLALGMTWGIGTVVLLFYNGIVLGAVASDYVLAGETKFLLGWLLPHGVVEIPAILLAGQAGLVLAAGLLGGEEPLTMKGRLRRISGDLVTLIFGLAILLVWAGLVEAFFSQYHEPLIPYSIKIAFGLIELALLILFLGKSGSEKKREAGI